MKNFKKIVAILLVVMMVVPMMTTGLSVNAATVTPTAAEGDVTTVNTSVYGTSIGGWRLLSSSTGALHPSQDYEPNKASVTVTANGQIGAFTNKQYDFSYPTFARLALESEYCTAIDGLYVLNANKNSSDSGSFNAAPKVMSYAFSEQPLQGGIGVTGFAVDEGFSGEMVTDGLVITFKNTDSTTSRYDSIVAKLYKGGELQAIQEVDTIVNTSGFGIELGHPNAIVFGLKDGVPSVTVRDSYSDYTNPQYIYSEYLFTDLYDENYKTGADYYFSVGTGYDYDTSDTSAFGSGNIWISRIGSCTLDADRKVTSVDLELENVAAWAGNGTPTCAHVWTTPEDLDPSPDCTNQGFQRHQCTLCDKIETYTVDAYGHDWDAFQTTDEPTCTTAGSKYRTCQRCWLEDQQTIKKLGHDKYETARVSASCTQDGYYERACTRCEWTEHVVIPALGDHTWVYTYKTYPTVDEAGLADRACSVCETSETDVEIPYTLDFYWTTSAKNKVSNLNPGYAAYDDNAYFEGDINGLHAQDMTRMYSGDFAYYPQNLVMSKFTTDIVYTNIEVQPNLFTFEDQTVGYPSAIGYVWTTHPEEYNDVSKTSSSGTFGADGYFMGFYSSQAGGAGDGEYSLVVTLSDDIPATNQYAGYAGGAGGTAGDGYYEKLSWLVVNNDNFTYYGGVTLATPIEADSQYQLELCRDYDPNTGKFVFGIYLPYTDEYIDLGGAVDKIAVDQQYYIGVEAFGYGVNQHNATFDITDIKTQNPAEFKGYTHKCEYTHSSTPATCTGAGSEFDICIYCGDKQNVVDTPATGHDFDADTGVCKNGCGNTSTIKADGVYVADMTEAVTKVANNGTIDIFKNTKISETLSISEKNVTINLNGYKLYANNIKVLSIGANAAVVVNGTGSLYNENTTQGVEAAAIEVSGSTASLTLNNATVYSYNKTDVGLAYYTIYVKSSGTLTVNGGTLYNRTASEVTDGGKATIYNNKGYVYINGGTFYTRDVFGNPSTTACFKFKSQKATVIKGGTFKKWDPTTYVAEGYEVTNDGNDIYTVAEAKAVTLDGTGYANIEAAWAALTAGEHTIQLQKDVTTANILVVNNEVDLTLDLNGFALTPAAELTSTKGLINVNYGGKLTVADGVGTGKISTGSNDIYVGVLLTTPEDAANTANGNAVVVIEGGLIEGEYYAVSGNGSRNGTELTVNGGTLKNIAEDGCAIYNPQLGTVTVNDGTITGYDAAVEIRSGDLNIYGGTFTALNPNFSAAPNGGGTTIKGAAIAVSQHTTANAINVTIEDGEFYGTYAIYEASLQGEASDVAMSVTGGTFNGAGYSQNCGKFITGGTFSVDPTIYVAEGYIARANGDVYEVGEAIPFSASADEDSITVTCGDAKKVKRWFIGSGTLSVYRDVMDNLVMTNTYDKTFDADPGEYTCCVRYTDGSEEFYYVTVTGTGEVVPTITTDGSQIFFSDLDDIKCIRIAEGTYTTRKQIKAAAGMRTIVSSCFTLNEYMINTKKSGTFTVMTSTYGGQDIIKTYTITADCDGVVITNKGNKVEFSNVGEGVKCIRYAAGEFTDVQAIKKAPDCRTTSKKGTFDSKYISGLHTFIIQGYDGSIAIQQVDVK